MANLYQLLHLEIVHYSPLITRKKSLETALIQHKFTEINWTTEKDISTQTSNKFVFTDEINFVSESDFAAGLRLNSFSQQFSRLTSSRIISVLKFFSKFNNRAKTSIQGALPGKKPLPNHWYEVSLMHIEALQRGIDSGKNWILILEDDAIIQDNFMTSLRIIERPPRAKHIWINLNDGVGPNLFKSKSDKSLDFLGFYLVNPPMTRCTVAYLVNRELAIQILDELSVYGIPNWVPIDFTLDAVIKKHKVTCIWQDPACVFQGSSNGSYESSLKKLPNTN
jgi:hypothetical protein